MSHARKNVFHDANFVQNFALYVGACESAAFYVANRYTRVRRLVFAVFKNILVKQLDRPSGHKHACASNSSAAAPYT